MFSRLRWIGVFFIWPSTIKLEERDLVVDSSASMHVSSKEDLNLADLETVRVSRRPTTVITADGSVDTNEKATVYVSAGTPHLCFVSVLGCPTVVTVPLVVFSSSLCSMAESRFPLIKRST